MTETLFGFIKINWGKILLNYDICIKYSKCRSDIQNSFRTLYLGQAKVIKKILLQWSLADKLASSVDAIAISEI